MQDVCLQNAVSAGVIRYAYVQTHIPAVLLQMPIYASLQPLSVKTWRYLTPSMPVCRVHIAAGTVTPRLHHMLLDA